MKSKRSHEGYLQIDHRASPGNVEVPEGTQFEGALVRCNHCHNTILKNPLRTRPSVFFYCRKCDGYACEACGDPLLTGCKNLEVIFDRLQEEAFKNLNLKQI